MLTPGALVLWYRDCGIELTQDPVIGKPKRGIVRHPAAATTSPEQSTERHQSVTHVLSALRSPAWVKGAPLKLHT